MNYEQLRIGIKSMLSLVFGGCFLLSLAVIADVLLTNGYWITMDASRWCRSGPECSFASNLEPGLQTLCVSILSLLASIMSLRDLRVSLHDSIWASKDPSWIWLFLHPYPTFVFDLDAYPDPAFQKKWCGSGCATQLDYLYIKKTKNNIVISFEKQIFFIETWPARCFQHCFNIVSFSANIL